MSLEPWLYIKCPPGSGKSAVLIEIAVRCARDMDLDVLIVCPTGRHVYSLQSQLPEFQGVERIRVDTIQGILRYQDPGKDGLVHRAPPSAHRRIEVILCEEASQYENVDFKRFFKSVREQPHRPYCATVADFAQMRPVCQGGFCEKLCGVIE